jgi:hypothetical protein
MDSIAKIVRMNACALEKNLGKIARPWKMNVR